MDTLKLGRTSAHGFFPDKDQKGWILSVERSDVTLRADGMTPIFRVNVAENCKVFKVENNKKRALIGGLRPNPWKTSARKGFVDGVSHVDAAVIERG
jgi:hypothetical protein